MYGDKQEKQKRLQKILAVIARSGGTLSQAALARIVGVSRSTINKDLIALHERGVMLAEDETGHLSLLSGDQ
jgi:DeoR/GlpR family transcriptional regulator of sugar metabolism